MEVSVSFMLGLLYALGDSDTALGKWVVRRAGLWHHGEKKFCPSQELTQVYNVLYIFVTAWQVVQK
jgi:hypothetical protein